jgi:hypothetical protein
MANYANHLFAASARIRPCRSQIRTTVQNTDASHNKAHPITLTNWRYRATAASSPVLNGKGKEPARYDENENPCTRLDSETDTSFSGPQYRYPRESRVPWEAVGSAPAWQLASSSSSSSDDNQREVTKVHLKNVNRILTTVNGEEIALPNRFSLEVSPVDPENAPSGLGMGELRRLDRSVPFRRLASEASDDILAKLREIVNANHETLNSTTAATSGSSVAGLEPSRAREEALKDKEARFQVLLSRLQKHKPSSSTHEPGDASAHPHRLVDPAIVAMKVRDNAGVSGRDALSSTEAANAYFAEQLKQMRNKGKQRSTDSGYASKEDMAWDAAKACVAEGKACHTRHASSSLDGGQSKVLNPAAAEFKSAARHDGAPWLSPGKMSRTPLTNVFPDATLRTARTIRPPPGFEHLAAQPLVPSPVPIRPPPGFEHLAGSGLHPAPPTRAVPSAPVSGTPMAMPGIAAFNTFPPGTTTTPTLPVCTQPMPVGVTVYLPPPVTANPYGTTLPARLQPPQQPFPAAAVGPLSNNANGSITTVIPGSSTSNRVAPRPYFPVTTKPRDHDPVKQQMYEEYLEWRKANEPGYHMRCKMRQAQRVVRQYQQVQEKKGCVAGPSGSGRGNGNEDWKVIAEKAKAAVRAAARAAEEEKRRREEAVREEMRVKVRELSEGRGGGVEEGKGKGKARAK